MTPKRSKIGFKNETKNQKSEYLIFSSLDLAGQAFEKVLTN